MQKIFLRNDTKDIEGFVVPLCFFGGNTRIIEKCAHTSVIACGEEQIEVLNDYILERPHR